MSHKYFYIVITILLLIGSVSFLFHFTSIPSDVDIVESETILSEDKSEKGVMSRLHLHPLASKEKLEAAVKQPISSWEEWLRASIELEVGKVVAAGSGSTPVEVAELRERIRDVLLEQQAYYIELQKPLPKNPGALKIWSPYYNGPQTSSALIAEFDGEFLKHYPESADWDKHYPKEEWLQMLLDKGVQFQEYSDYSHFLNLRRDLLHKKEQPDEWKSGKYGIPITTDFKEYAVGLVDRKVWENNILEEVSAQYPYEPGRTVFFPSTHPDKYLPVIGKMAYINIEVNGSMATWGTSLTLEERQNLFYKGIEPEGIDIVYIDNEFNLLSEKPKPFKREERQKANSYVVSYDGIPITPENYEDLLGKPMPDQWEKWYEKKHGEETRDPVELSSVDVAEAARADAQEAAAAAQEAAKVEFEKFENSIRQLEEFATMSDTEIEKQLEKQFRQQFLPKNPLEQLEQFTPERLEKALGTLFQHGFEEGFRRVRRDSPALAEQLEQYFGQGQKPPPEMQKKPQRPAPPKPSEAAPSEPEAP